MLKVLKKIFHYMFQVYCYVMGNLIALFMYDRKYLKSKYFKDGRFFGVNSMGWRWVIHDFRGRVSFGTNIGVNFPVSPFNHVSNPDNIEFSPDAIITFQGKGKYFQALGNGKITIGDGCYIANNVGIVATNHDLSDISCHAEGTNVIIGDNCWLAMNSMILPGVILGNNVIVGAGSVVTKSFEEGNCVIAGNPAKKIKVLDKD